MGTYYYLKDKKSDEGLQPVYEDDYLQTIFSIAKKNGLKINDGIILKELNRKKAKTRKSKCIILIDGSNFYFKLKDLDLHDLLNFDFSGFTKMLGGEENEVVKATHYVGKIRTDGTEKTQILFNNQRKLLAHLKRHRYTYSLGYLMKTDGKYHEKGVDVNIAVDILVATYENLCDKVILVSSDTDLLPAILKAKEKGKSIEYIGFSHKPSVAMVANCSASRLLTKADLTKFIKRDKKQ